MDGANSSKKYKVSNTVLISCSGFGWEWGLLLEKCLGRRQRRSTVSDGDRHPEREGTKNQHSLSKPCPLAADSFLFGVSDRLVAQVFKVS